MTPPAAAKSEQRRYAATWVAVTRAPSRCARVSSEADGAHLQAGPGEAKHQLAQQREAARDHEGDRYPAPGRRDQRRDVAAVEARGLGAEQQRDALENEEDGEGRQHRCEPERGGRVGRWSVRRRVQPDDCGDSERETAVALSLCGEEREDHDDEPCERSDREVDATL